MLEIVMQTTAFSPSTVCKLASIQQSDGGTSGQLSQYLGIHLFLECLPESHSFNMFQPI